MADIRDAAVSFEAKKVSMKQDKNGYILTLSIHPVDVPDEVLRAWVGARYTVAMVQLDDQEQPIMSDAQKEGPHAVQLAGILCRDPEFMKFLGMETGSPIFGHEECRATLCSILGIESRAELKTDEDARIRFLEIRDGFIKWRDD